MTNLTLSVEDVACPVDDIRKWFVHSEVLLVGEVEGMGGTTRAQVTS